MLCMIICQCQGEVDMSLAMQGDQADFKPWDARMGGSMGEMMEEHEEHADHAIQWHSQWGPRVCRGSVSESRVLHCRSRPFSIPMAPDIQQG